MAAKSYVRIEFSKWGVALEALRNQAPKALMRAINRTASNSKTAMTRVVADDMGLKQSAVRPKITIENATQNTLQAFLYGSPKRVPLIEFKAKGPEPSRGRGRGVTAKIPGGAGRYPNAFIATMRGGRRKGERGVLQRAPGSSRLPVYELFGPSIKQAFEKNGETARTRAMEMLNKNVQHEIEFALKSAKQA